MAEEVGVFDISGELAENKFTRSHSEKTGRSFPSVKGKSDRPALPGWPVARRGRGVKRKKRPNVFSSQRLI